MADMLQTLTEMGFSEGKAKLALEKTGGSDIQVAMDWILSHDDEPVSEATTESTEKPEATEPNSPTIEGDTQEDASAVAKSIKCEDCGKLFRTQVEVEFHAAKSGHSNFSESTEEKKPLTEEEKKEQLARIENKLKQRRLEREEREKQEELEREKNRIKSGKEMLEAKKKHEELEIKKIVELRKREKEEERMAKQRIREQIEQDKLARRAKFGGGAQPVEKSETPPAMVSSPPATVTSPNYLDVKLQIRLTNGSTLTQTFKASEPLSAVRLYITLNRTDGDGAFSLMTTFPRKVFEYDDYDKPLSLLGLAPSAVIILAKAQ